MGYRQAVLPLMQVLSNKSRAYIVNSKGLPGFLVKADWLQILECSNVDKYQEINFGDIEDIIKGHRSLDDAL